MRAVNLIPAEQREGVSVGAGRSGGAAYAVMALLAGVALLAFLYGRSAHQISSRRTQVAETTAKTQRAQAQAQQLAPYTTFAALREQRMKAVADLVDSRFDWAHAIHEFGRVLPLEVSVSSLSGTIGGPGSGGSASSSPPPPSTTTPASTPSSGSSSSASSSSTASASGAGVTSATPPGSVPQFTLTGCAMSQAAVALMLDRLRLIDGVTNVTLQSSTKAGISAGGSGAAGSCLSSQPAYSVQIAFAPLPTSEVTRSTALASSKTPSGGSR
jgi:Tfp pilus assembly protein PilN